MGQSASDLNVQVKDLVTAGPTIHTAFARLPFERKSQQTSSLFQPPILAYQSPGCIKILGDIYRFEAARERGDLRIAAYLLGEVTGNLDLIRAVIDYYQPDSLVDRALIIEAAIQMGFNAELAARQILPLLALPATPSVVGELQELAALDERLLALIHEKGLSLKRARTLLRIKPVEEWSVALLTQLQPGINVFLEILQNLWEISGRDDLTLETVITRLELADVSVGAHEQAPEKLKTIRTIIHAQRYPSLTSSNLGLSQAVEDLELPGSTTISWDPNFERRGVQLKADLSDVNSVEVLRQLLDKRSFLSLFEKI